MEPEGERLLAAVEEIGPWAEADRPAADAAGRLSDRVVDALDERGLLAMKLPAAVGGGDLSGVVAATAIERLAVFDGAAAWNAMAMGTAGAFVASRLPDAGVEAVAGSGAWPRFAGTFPASGRARAVPGGWRISGRWGFASGILHASWVACGCVIEGAAGGDPDRRLLWCALPARRGRGRGHLGRPRPPRHRQHPPPDRGRLRPRRPHLRPRGRRLPRRSDAPPAHARLPARRPQRGSAGPGPPGAHRDGHGGRRSAAPRRHRLERRAGRLPARAGSPRRHPPGRPGAVLRRARRPGGGRPGRSSGGPGRRRAGSGQRRPRRRGRGPRGHLRPAGGRRRRRARPGPRHAGGPRRCSS